MTDQVVLPSMERAVVAYLESLDLDVEHIGSRVPSDLSRPWIRIQDLGGPQLGQPAWLYENLVQVDCYGGSDDSVSDDEAENLHNEVRVLLPAFTTDECVVLRVSSASLGRVPDEEIEPTRARYLLQITLRWRPATDGS